LALVLLSNTIFTILHGFYYLGLKSGKKVTLLCRGSKKHAIVFIIVRHFNSSLIFVGKSGGYL